MDDNKLVRASHYPSGFLSRIIKRFVKGIITLSTKGLKVGPHITRYSMYQHLAFVLNALEKKGSHYHVLSISRSTYLSRLLDLLGIASFEIKEANFPEYDMLALPFPDESFDYVVSDQVLEHVEGNPQQAFDETYRILKPGGIAVHTTCLIYPVHSDEDFWRFTPKALVLLCHRFSKIIHVGGWGNRYVWFLDWFDLKSLPVPHARWHPLHRMAVKNDPQWPAVTWVVAQK